MVLVNGSEGIGTGLSSFIPNFNPRDIIAKIRGMLDNNKTLPPMDPFYRGFVGSIKKSATQTYTVKGVIEKMDGNRWMITELPVRRGTDEYKLVLDSAVEEGFIKNFQDHSTDTVARFEVFIDQEKLPANQGLLKKLKLTTSISTTNMHLFDATGKIKKYSNAEEILEDFYKSRLEMYEKRKKYCVFSLEEEEQKLKNKVRFIEDVIVGTVNLEEAELVTKLQELNYAPFQENESSSGNTNGAEEPVVNSQEGGLRLPLVHALHVVY